MPEIGYWKYVRFTEDEPLYFGTEDDITVVCDSADDRLEYRMKKDIRFEDDAGNKILTIQKATRTLSGFNMTGNLSIEKDSPEIRFFATAGGISLKGYDSAGVFTCNFGFDFANDRWFFYDPINVSNRLLIHRTGDIVAGANVDLSGHLMKNMKLGTDLKTNGYNISHGVANTDALKFGGGSTVGRDTGAVIELFGNLHASYPGYLVIGSGMVNNPWAKIHFKTADTTPVMKERIVINQGDTPDLDIKNAFLDFHDQTLAATAGALQGYVIMKVGGTKFKFPAYALT